MRPQLGVSTSSSADTPVQLIVIDAPGKATPFASEASPLVDNGLVLVENLTRSPPTGTSYWHPDPSRHRWE